MGFVKFMRFLRLRLRLRRRRVAERVAAVDFIEAEDGLGDGGGKREGMMVFSWEEVERYTVNFSVVIGHGGFSAVYLARLPDSSTAAVKIQYCSSERLNQAYKQELEILRQLRHPNIVRLLGYCDDREEGLLILEHAPNGNLQDQLHGSTNKAGGLPWKRRMAIAFQLAQALEYLHDKFNVVHGDIKASNILLDQQLNCKLCDFGSAKMGFSSLVAAPSCNRRRLMMQGSPGYTDPHYLRTGLASKKNDVYSFGVVLLEFVTGIEALDSMSGERLTARAEPVLQGVEKVAEIVDPRLIGQDPGFNLEEASAVTAIAAMCLCDNPSRRPLMSDILVTMTNKLSSISHMHV